MAVTEITIGKSGDGKTYSVVRQLIEEWLPFSHNRNLITNLPLNVDAIAEFYVTEKPDVVSSWVTSRIQLIPKEITDSWMAEQSGPWAYFHETDLSGCRIVLDEIHNYVHIKSSQKYIHEWRKWLGELRHMGCEFEAISQYETKIHPLIRHECGLKRVIRSFNDMRDPLVWVRFYDHFQLLSKLRGYWATRVWYKEYQPSSDGAGTWEKCGGGTIELIPRFYRLYNSYSAPIAGHGKAAVKQPHPFQTMKWGELLRWYFKRNTINIVASAIVYSLLIYLFVFGGILTIFMSVTGAVMNNKTAQNKEQSKDSKETKDTKETKTSDKKDTKDIPNEPSRPAIYSPRGTFDAGGRPWVPVQAGNAERPKA